MKTDSLHSMLDPRTQTAKDMDFYSTIGKYFQASVGDTLDKLKNFPKYVPRQNMALFLAKNEIFKEILNVHGNIVECGVFVGGGLMTWAQLSAIYEPYNHLRRVIGFDSFEGFPGMSERDASGLSGCRNQLGCLPIQVTIRFGRRVGSVS